MRSNVCVNEMALFGPLAAFVKDKIFYDSHGEKGGLPTRRDSDPPGMAVLSIDIYGFDVFSYTVWCAIVAGEICSKSSDGLGSATAAGIVRDSVFKLCVLLS